MSILTKQREQVRPCPGGDGTEWSGVDNKDELTARTDGEARGRAFHPGLLNREGAKRLKISLLISAYDQPQALDKVLRGVSQQTRAPDEVFIADDGSDEETESVIGRWQRKLAMPVHHLWHPHDGFRKVILLNRAVAAATGDYLVFTDGDCVPHPRYIADHERLAEPGFWVQGRRCYVKESCVPQFDIGTTLCWHWMLTGRIGGVAKAIRLPYPVTFRNQEQRGIIGCNMAFWRKDVLAVNGFDETYLGRGITPDSDLGTRVYNLGRQRKFVYAHAIVYHLNHPVAPRENFETKRKWLAETIRTGKVRAARGLDQHQHSQLPVRRPVPPPVRA